MESLLQNNLFISLLILSSVLSSFIDVILGFSIKRLIVKYKLKTFIEIFATAFATTRNITLIGFVILLLIGKFKIC